MQRQIRTVSIAFVGLSLVALNRPASGATLPYCPQAKALQAANLVRAKLDPGDVSYPKANVSSFDAIIKAQKSLEAKLTGNDKAIMTAERKQTEKIRAAVAKAKTKVEQTQNEMAVRVDFTPGLIKAGEAYSKLYPAIDKACGTNILGRHA